MKCLFGFVVILILMVSSVACAGFKEGFQGALIEPTADTNRSDRSDLPSIAPFTVIDVQTGQPHTIIPTGGNTYQVLN